MSSLRLKTIELKLKKTDPFDLSITPEKFPDLLNREYLVIEPPTAAQLLSVNYKLFTIAFVGN